MKEFTLKTLAICTLTIFVPMPAPLWNVANAHEYGIRSQITQDESNAYKQFFDASQSRDYNRAAEMAKQYLESYPDGVYSAYLKKWLESGGKTVKRQTPIYHRLKPDESNSFRQWFDAFQGRDYDRAAQLAKQHLESYPYGVYTDYLKKWLESDGKQTVKEQTPIDHRVEALSIAASNGHTKVLFSILQSLIEEGGNINMEIKSGKTVLMMAAAEGQSETVLALIRKGAKVNKREKKHGYSALIFAVWRGDTDTVQVLIDHGADVNVMDVDESSALSFALVRGHAEVVKLLRKAGAHQ